MVPPIDDDEDQDALAAEWEAALAAEGGGDDGGGDGDGGDQDDLAAEWEAMVAGGDGDGGDVGDEMMTGGVGRESTRFSTRTKSIACSVLTTSMKIRSSNRASRRSSIRPWFPTNVCQCSRWSSTAWSG